MRATPKYRSAGASRLGVGVDFGLSFEFAPLPCNGATLRMTTLKTAPKTAGREKFTPSSYPKVIRACRVVRTEGMITLLLAALLAQANPPAVKPAVIVHMKNFAFVPAKVQIKPGDVVEWINDDTDAHTVDSPDKLFDSGGLDTHDTYTHAFATTGSFAYFCSLHPYMKGTVVVK
jgi:plastocyanin